MLFVKKMDIEKGLVCTFGDHALGIAQTTCANFTIFEYGGISGRCFNLGRLLAVKLAYPGFTTVNRFQDNTTVTNSPTGVSRDKMTIGQRDAGWYDLRLAPGLTVIVRQHNNAHLADSHQTLAGSHNGIQYGRLGSLGMTGGHFQNVDAPTCVSIGSIH